MAGSRFETPEWHAVTGAMVGSDSGAVIARNLMAAIDQVTEHSGASLIAFHTDAAPEVLHHSLSPENARHYLERYLAGPYLLDPLYELALGNDRPEMCRFRDTIPDRFHSSEYYRQYCERTHLKDEIDFMVGVENGSALVLVIGHRDRMYSRAELRRLTLIKPVLRAAMQRVWNKWRSAAERNLPDRAIHQRLTECFRSFGEDVLTQREREISKLLLRGHSTKSVARELDIAPGTVMVHKRNLFSKLGITSQYELFSRFIDDLSGPAA